MSNNEFGQILNGEEPTSGDPQSGIIIDSKGTFKPVLQSDTTKSEPEQTPSQNPMTEEDITKNFDVQEIEFTTNSVTDPSGQRYYTPGMSYQAETNNYEATQNAVKAPETDRLVVATEKKDNEIINTNQFNSIPKLSSGLEETQPTSEDQPSTIQKFGNNQPQQVPQLSSGEEGGQESAITNNVYRVKPEDVSERESYPQREKDTVDDQAPVVIDAKFKDDSEEGYESDSPDPEGSEHERLNRLERQQQDILQKINSLENTINALREELANLRNPQSNTEPETTPTPVDTNQVIADLRAGLVTPQGDQNPQVNANINAPDLPQQDQDTTLPITPEIPDLEQIRKERNLKRAAFVAGVVAGGATGLLGGVSVLPVAGTVVLVGGLGSTGLRALGNWRVNKLGEKLNDPTLAPEERTKIENRIGNWQKVVKVVNVTKSFFTGAGIGLLASTIISKAFMGGEGLLDKWGHAQTPDASTVANSNINKTPGMDKASGRITPDSVPTETVTPETLPTEGVLVQNGHVNLPDSAWNGNLAGESVGNLPGEALNYSNYTGGWHEMAPRMLENDLISGGITRNQLLDNLGTSGTHRLLNWYLQQIQNGVADPNLIQALQNMNTPGAQELLNIVGK